MEGPTYDATVQERTTSPAAGTGSRTRTPKPPKATRANGRASRAAILNAALEVFARRGYAGTTMAEIASCVGLTQPALLHHFRGKDELLLEVIRGRDEAADYLNDLAPVDVIPQMIRDNLAQPVLCLLFTTLAAEAVRDDHPAHDYFVQRYRKIMARLADDYHAAGLTRKEAMLLARDTVATIDGIHQQWLLDPDEVDLKEMLTFFEQRLRSTIASLRSQHRGNSRRSGGNPQQRNRPRRTG